MKRILPLAVAAAALAMVGFGCNPVASIQNKVDQKVGDAVASKVLSAASGGAVNVNSNDNGSYTFTDNKTGSSMAIGTDVKIPDTFPKDVPVYPGAKATSVIISKDTDGGASLTLSTSDTVQTVAGWYDTQFKNAGFSQDTNMTAGGMEIRGYSKATVKMELTVAAGDSDQAGSTISVTRTEDTSDSGDTSTDTGE